MKIDLSVTLTEDILQSFFQLDATGQIPPVGKFGHIGTHFDAMDKTFSLDNTEREGILFDVSHIRDREIEVTDIASATIQENDFILFHTGWLQKHPYGSPGYFKNHPELSQALITYLVNKKVSLIGVDMTGIRQAAGHAQADQYCADHHIFVIENLANLDMVLQKAQGRRFLVHTYPVNYAGLSGLPCRVVAEI